MKPRTKTVVLLLIVAISCSLLSMIFYPSAAACWHCNPKRCYFELDCDLGCFCYKGEYELNGVCVTE